MPAKKPRGPTLAHLQKELEFSRADRARRPRSGSEEAELASEVRKLAAMYRDLPDVREDRLEEARAKLRAGVYFTRQVAEEVAERILREG